MFGSFMLSTSIFRPSPNSTSKNPNNSTSHLATLRSGTLSLCARNRMKRWVLPTIGLAQSKLVFPVKRPEPGYKITVFKGYSSVWLPDYVGKLRAFTRSLPGGCRKSAQLSVIGCCPPSNQTDLSGAFNPTTPATCPNNAAQTRSTPASRADHHHQSHPHPAASATSRYGPPAPAPAPGASPPVHAPARWP